MDSLQTARALLANNKERVLGLIFVVLAAVIWVLASFLVQAVEDRGLSPFLLTYISNSLFVVYLPVYSLLQHNPCVPAARTGLGEAVDATAGETESLQPEQLPAAPPRTTEPKLWGYFERDVLRAALVVAPLWFLGQLTFNVSLHLTSVTSNTILSSTASLFTYGLSWLLLNERFVPHKLVSIIACAAGSTIVTLGDSSAIERPSSVSGDALCLLSAVFYACYTVALKVMLGGDSEARTMLFFGYVGLLNLVALAPILLVLQFASVVQIGQLTAALFGITILKGLFDNVLSDYMLARAVLLLGPTIATAGMSIQVPLAVALDIIWVKPSYVHDPKAVTLMILGGWFVLAGFVGINVPPKRASIEGTKVRTHNIGPN